LFGGDSPDDPMDELRKQVQAVVTDPERAETILASVHRMDQLLTESAALLVKAAQEERALFVKYDSTPMDYRTLFSETRRDRQRLQEAILDMHLAIKAQATPGEWQMIRPVQANAVSAKVESLVLAALNQRS
jgi:allophanate hydrolase subunit 1